jgi:hypothetical protein
MVPKCAHAPRAAVFGDAHVDRFLVDVQPDEHASLDLTIFAAKGAKNAKSKTDQSPCGGLR